MFSCSWAREYQAVLVDRITISQDVHTEPLGPVDMIHGKKDCVDVVKVKSFEMGGVSWIIQVGPI